MSSTTVDKTLFEGGTSFDWETYLRCRPDYTQSNFYSLIWEYHDKHQGGYEVAYDVGTGPGNVAAVLSSKFKSVKASDISAFHIAVARDRYKDLSNVTFSDSRAEDLPGNSTADLVTVAECLPLMEIDTAMAAFSRLFETRGTLAIWFYGGPIYTGSDTSTRELQHLHRTITSRSFDQLRPLNGPAWSAIGSWLDVVSLPSETWTDVRRTKWHSNYPLKFSDDAHDDDSPSNVGEHEIVEKVDDPTFWKKDVDFAWAKGFIDAQIPRKESYLTEEVKTMFKRMEELMNGKTHPITWPVVLILATKR